MLPQTTKFAFGDNWFDFAKILTESQVVASERCLERLLGTRNLSGLTFLDIGSGSGLSSLAALRLGAHVTSFDCDAQSVVCTQQLRKQFRPNDDEWSIQQGSVLDEEFLHRLGVFDIVYSWGALHHTGAMWSALKNAASMVKPGGILAVAIYRKTPFCSLWRIEKRIYTAAPSSVQAIVRSAYKSAFFLSLLVKGNRPVHYIKNYQAMRGMSWSHDVHDWLGGYPYESASPAELKKRAGGLGFRLIRLIEQPGGIGLFGSGCNEYVFQRGNDEAVA